MRPHLPWLLEWWAEVTELDGTVVGVAGYLPRQPGARWNHNLARRKVAEVWLDQCQWHGRLFASPYFGERMASVATLDQVKREVEGAWLASVLEELA